MAGKSVMAVVLAALAFGAAAAVVTTRPEPPVRKGAYSDYFNRTEWWTSG
jgi:hypothetical protein